MRILVLGAGAIGGYFGGRLLAAGREVTFLVRHERARHMATHGLTIRSAAGTVTLPAPPTIRAEQLDGPYDLIILSCKAYDLSSAIEAIKPAIGPQTLVLPLLNGMRHLEILDQKLGQQAVLGGTCFISTRLEPQGHILHLSDVHTITFGARHPDQASRIADIATAIGDAGFDIKVSDNILLDMWEKWIFLASMAGLSCLFQGTIGDIATAGGADVALGLLKECTAIATDAGYAPRPEMFQFAAERLTNPDSLITASMLGDVERQGPTEADHVLGDLLSRRRSSPQPDFSLLRIAYLRLQVYLCRLNRESRIDR